MKFARYTFLIAAIYGLLILLPYFFLESQVGTYAPPAITHPEFYYGFLGVASVFQLIFIVIAFDPSSFRVLIPIAILEKLSFGITCVALYFAGRMEASPFFIGGMIDLVLAALFTAALVKVIRGPVS